MEKNIREEVARNFGEFLDQDDFLNFESLLADNCKYEIGDQVLNTKASIAGLYEKNMKEGKVKFDELVWGKSEIEEITENQYYIYFSDFLKHKGMEHNYKCKQQITINSDNLIEEIVHIELPGEKESLQKFYAKVGIT